MTHHWHVNVSAGISLLVGTEEKARAEQARLADQTGSEPTIHECYQEHRFTRGKSRRREAPDGPPA